MREKEMINIDITKDIDGNKQRYNPLQRHDEEISQEKLTGERALYRARNLKVHDSVFMDGESPLKESANIELYGCEFQYKYPLWYSQNIYAKDCTWQEMGRSGVWYTKHIEVVDSVIAAPKNFRRCEDVKITRSSMPDAKETFWMCKDIKLDMVTAKGDYFGMNCDGVELDHFILYGNYAFDGAKNIHVKNSKLITKDCFWNCENVVVEDSFISGEYLAWNTKNITFINCTIESDQGLDYIDGLKMVNCKLVNTGYAFEYSKDIDAEVVSKLDSILNPGNGRIRVKALDKLIIEDENCDFTKTEIVNS